MPLPQQVVEQLGKDSVETPGWSGGLLLFSSSIFGIILAIYLGLTYGYQPYLNGGISQARTQMATLSQSISPAEQAELLTYYSQIANLNTIVAGHVFFSQFFSWLEANTEANVYYASLNFASHNQVTLAAFGKTQDDVNKQIEIFESSPDVSAVSVPSVSFSPATGMWAFNVTLTLDQSLVQWQSAGATTTTAVSATTGSPATTTSPSAAVISTTTSP